MEAVTSKPVATFFFALGQEMHWSGCYIMPPMQVEEGQGGNDTARLAAFWSKLRAPKDEGPDKEAPGGGLRDGSGLAKLRVELRRVQGGLLLGLCPDLGVCR